MEAGSIFSRSDWNWKFEYRQCIHKPTLCALIQTQFEIGVCLLLNKSWEWQPKTWIEASFRFICLLHSFCLPAPRGKLAKSLFNQIFTDFDLYMTIRGSGLRGAWVSVGLVKVAKEIFARVPLHGRWWRSGRITYGVHTILCTIVESIIGQSHFNSMFRVRVGAIRRTNMCVSCLQIISKNIVETMSLSLLLLTLSQRYVYAEFEFEFMAPINDYYWLNSRVLVCSLFYCLHFKFK